jgi:hypothetical protein
VRISESYHDAGPLRVLARLDHKSPRLLGGNPARSKRFFDRAIELAPKNPVTLLYAAELAIDQHDIVLATLLLNELVNADSIDPEWEFETVRDRAIARTLLEEIQDKNR